MLELRPNCELCDRDLPPNSLEARICTYECTYCVSCVETVLENVCPTCGGDFARRPIRPSRAWRSELDLGLAHHPASSRRRHSNWSATEIGTMTQLLRETPPQDR